MFLILALILIGMVAGAVAERVVYPEWKIDWTEAFAVGIAGSLLVGITTNLIAGEGFGLSVSGLIGSAVGAIVLLAILKWVRGRIVRAAEE